MSSADQKQRDLHTKKARVKRHRGIAEETLKFIRFDRNNVCLFIKLTEKKIVAKSMFLELTIM